MLVIDLKGALRIDDDDFIPPGAKPSLEVDMVTQVQNLDEAVCISHTVNTLGKGINSTIPPPAMGK